MALLAARSKKALVSAIMIPLLMALVTASVSSTDVVFDYQNCVDWPRCDMQAVRHDNTCGGRCAVLGIDGIGICTYILGASKCCCIPRQALIDAQRQLHH